MPHPFKSLFLTHTQRNILFHKQIKSSQIPFKNILFKNDMHMQNKANLNHISQTKMYFVKSRFLGVLHGVNERIFIHLLLIFV